MSAFSQPTSRYCSNSYLINCTDALEFIIGLTGVCKLRNPQKRSVWTTAPTFVFRHRKFNRRKTLASASGFIAPTPSLCSSSVHPVYSLDFAFSESIAPVSTICLSSVQPVIVNCLCLGPFDLISSGFCIFSSLGPISLIMVILTHILVQVLCVSSIAKTLY